LRRSIRADLIAVNARHSWRLKNRTVTLNKVVAFMAKRNRLALDAGSLLECIPLFSGLDANHIAKLASHCRLIELSGHRSLYSSGQPIHEIYYLISGSVKRFTMRTNNMENVLEIIDAGHAIALAETLSASEHFSYAETLEHCAVLTIGLEGLRQVLPDHSELAYRLLNSLAQQQYANEFARFRHHSLPVTQRVLDYLLKLAGENGRMAGETTVRLGTSKRLVASSLDMAPETFSRALRQLSEDGVIVVDGRKLHVQHAALSVASSGHAESSFPPLHYLRQERGFEPDTPAAVEMINLCGRHRMLSQRMASAWVLAQRKIDTPTARVGVRRFGEDFQRNLKRTALLPLAGFVRQHLEPLEDEWRTFRTLIEHAEDNEKLPLSVFDASERVLASADRLTTAAVKAASSNDARRIEFAARNRMLFARIIKLWLFADWGIAEETARKLIEVSAREFEDNLDRLSALVTYVPKAAAQLAIDREQWEHFSCIVKNDKRKTSNGTQIIAVISSGETLFRQVDATVKLFEQLALSELGEKSERRSRKYENQAHKPW
jgi:CRP-like cAMP-binding protein